MEYVDYGVFTSSVNTLFMPKYAREAASGRFGRWLVFCISKLSCITDKPAFRYPVS